MKRVQLGENILYATLSERESVASLVYVMKLTPTENKRNPKNFRLQDLTVEGDRVNKVKMTVVASANDEDFPNGLVFLLPGDYIYEIFNDTGKLLEKGVLQYDTQTPASTYIQQTVTEKVYNG